MVYKAVFLRCFAGLNPTVPSDGFSPPRCVLVLVFALPREQAGLVAALAEARQAWHRHGTAGVVSVGGVGERGEELQLGNWLQG